LQDAISQNPRTQTAPALKPRFSAGTQGRIHPMTRFALFDAGKTNALNLKLSPDQRIQVHTSDERITPSGGRLSLEQVEFAPQGIKNFLREEGDLTFVVRLELEKAITLDAAAGHAIDLAHLENLILPSGLAVVAEKVVTPPTTSLI
jgi:hypothetical protein